MVSFPSLPSMVSSPLPPFTLSLPAPAEIISAPSSPLITSSPPFALTVSSPAPALMVLFSSPTSIVSALSVPRTIPSTLSLMITLMIISTSQTVPSSNTMCSIRLLTIYQFVIVIVSDNSSNATPSSWIATIRSSPSLLTMISSGRISPVNFRVSFPALYAS